MREVTIVKYCLKCGRICAENSSQSYYNDNKCDCCGYKLVEDDMTPEKYDNLTEDEKDKYEQNLLKTIQNSSVFDEGLYSMYNKYGTSNFYYYFRFDKFEQMTGKRAGRKRTPEEEQQIKQRLEEQYGKNSPAYQQAIVQNCINAERAMKQESSNIPKCPTCNSTNITRISTTSKVVNVAMFGLLGQKRKHQFKCKNCGYEW